MKNNKSESYRFRYYKIHLSSSEKVGKVVRDNESDQQVNKLLDSL